MSAVGQANGAQIALAEIPLFAGLAPGAVERLERFMARFEIASGERLFLQDDHSGRMHVIEHGRLEVQVELPAGHRQALAELGPGELLGETSLLGGGRRVATAVAREPTSGWVLDRPDSKCSASTSARARSSSWRGSPSSQWRVCVRATR